MRSPHHNSQKVALREGCGIVDNITKEMKIGEGGGKQQNRLVENVKLSPPDEYDDELIAIEESNCHLVPRYNRQERAIDPLARKLLQ